MKKFFFLLIACISAFAVNAQVFVENFATATVGGDLESYNDWYVSAKSADALGVSPKIEAGALSYTGYYGSNVGNVAVLDSAVGVTSASQRISTRRIIFEPNDTLKPVAPSTIYAAFIVNINPMSYRSFRDFFTFEGSETSSMTRGRFFAKNNTAGDQVIFSVSKNSSTASILDANSTDVLSLTLNTGVNHLIVAKYQFIADADNDVVTMYVNPDLSKTEAEQTNKVLTTDVQSDYSATTPTPMKINLRQRGIGARIGGIRVGTSWDAVLLGANTAVKDIDANNSRIYAIGKNIKSEAGTIRVFNLNGAQIFSAKTEGELQTTLDKGLYIVRFVSTDGLVASAKLEIK